MYILCLYTGRPESGGSAVFSSVQQKNLERRRIGIIKGKLDSGQCKRKGIERESSQRTQIC